MAGMRFERVTGATTLGLRQRVLRPHQRLDEVVFPGDSDPDTAHVAALADDGEVIGVGTVGRQPSPRSALPPAPGGDAWPARRESPPPGDPPPAPGGRTDWRIRGMATAEAFRSQGIGRAVLDALLAHVGDRGGGLVWCNARIPAVGFYRRAGFVTRGEPWEEPDIGPHIVMERWVDPTELSAGDRAGP